MSRPSDSSFQNLKHQWLGNTILIWIGFFVVNGIVYNIAGNLESRQENKDQRPAAWYLCWEETIASAHQCLDPTLESKREG